MTRRLLRFATPTLCLLSLLSCLGTARLWRRSYSVTDLWYWERRDVGLERGSRLWLDRRVCVGSQRGVIAFEYARLDWSYPHDDRPRDWRWEVRRFRVKPDDLPFRDDAGPLVMFPISDDSSTAHFSRWHPGGMVYAELAGEYAMSDTWGFCLPHGAVATVLAIPPLLWIGRRGGRRYVRWKRARQGHCPACGYSLVGNISGVCPECGTVGARSDGRGE